MSGILSTFDCFYSSKFFTETHSSILTPNFCHKHFFSSNNFPPLHLRGKLFPTLRNSDWCNFKFKLSRGNVKIPPNNTGLRINSSESIDVFPPNSNSPKSVGSTIIGFQASETSNLSDEINVDSRENEKKKDLGSQQHEHDLAVAAKAIQLACRLSIRIQEKILIKTEAANSKEDQSLVTVADWGVQAIISWVLMQSYPQGTYSLIAEEDTEALENEEYGILARVVSAVNECLSEGQSVNLTPPEVPLGASDVLNLISMGNGEGGPTGRHWILDPIDGTLGFVRGDQYAVGLALMEEGKIVLGVLGCPNLPMRKEWLKFPHRFYRIAAKLFPPQTRIWNKGCVLTARKGNGTWMEPLMATYREDDANDNNNNGKRDNENGSAKKFCYLEEGNTFPQERVFVSGADDPMRATFVEPVEKANTQQSFSASVAGSIGMRSNPLRVYSMAKYATIARGDAEIYMKFARAGYKEKVWDHAAGVIIVEEAGGKVTDAGGNPLDFSQGRYMQNLDRGIIACCSPALLSQLLDAVDASWTSSRL